MMVLTANRLNDGRAVYLAGDGAWTEAFADAHRLLTNETEAALAAAHQLSGIIIDPYLIDADENGPAGRTALRETIRATGPTVRPDLARTEEPRT